MPTHSSSHHKIDIVGDIHGQLETLRDLGRHLGYDIDHGWAHPDGRVLVFLGDLVDRGEDSLGVCQLVMQLVNAGRAICLMGNHEYNLVGWRLGLETPKHSNRKTLADVEARPEPWAPVLDFLRDLPIALELPDLRVIHAVWHEECFAMVRTALAVPASTERPGETTIEWLRRHIVLRSPFGADGLRDGLPAEVFGDGTDLPHEVLIKGYETRVSPPFLDADGKSRDQIRATWWLEPAASTAPLTVFGHYWNLPPVPEDHLAAAPPAPSGTPQLREWQTHIAPFVPASGFHPLEPSTTSVCVDYNGLAAVRAGSCGGAYRWPEHEVAWVRRPFP